MPDDKFNLNEFSPGAIFLRRLPVEIWGAAARAAPAPEQSGDEFIEVEVVLSVRLQKRRHKHGKNSQRTWSVEEARISAAGGQPYAEPDHSELMTSAWLKKPEGGA
jgi:hypothetical protein